MVRFFSDNQNIQQILTMFYEFMDKYSPALMPPDVRSTIHELEHVLCDVDSRTINYPRITQYLKIRFIYYYFKY